MIKRTWEVSELEALAAGIVSETGVLREQYCQRAAEALVDFSHLTQPAQCPYIVNGKGGSSYCRLAESAKPAQAVDVEAIQRVIDELRGYCDASEDSCYGTLSTSLVREYADRLTAALPKDSNGAEGVGS